jgi:4-hydroxy-tetrahydrodipicolinate synthase
MLKKGFYCALGTPLDKDGNIVKHSLKAEIDRQIAVGASGLLLMGTMGMLGCVRSSQYEEAVKTAVDAVAGRVTLMVGAADNSLARLKDRIEILNKYDVAIVLTAPYYFSMSRQTSMTYFKAAADMTDHDIYLYDHPYTARYKLTFADVMELAAIKNYKGIKTGDAILIKTLHDAKDLKPDFTPIFSNSDLFAVGHAYGIEHILDGIFACFPATIQRAQNAFNRGDFETGKNELNLLMSARDEMIAMGIWPSFTCAMNLLGFEGNFSPDYEPELEASKIPLVKDILKRTGELCPAASTQRSCLT